MRVNVDSHSKNPYLHSQRRELLTDARAQAYRRPVPLSLVGAAQEQTHAQEVLTPPRAVVPTRRGISAGTKNGPTRGSSPWSVSLRPVRTGLLDRGPTSGDTQMVQM